MRRNRQINVLKLAQRIAEVLESGEVTELPVSDKQVDRAARTWLPPALGGRLDGGDARESKPPDA